MRWRSEGWALWILEEAAMAPDFGNLADEWRYRQREKELTLRTSSKQEWDLVADALLRKARLEKRYP